MDKSATILIVDDYLLIRTAVRGVLFELGFSNVLQADHGKTAEELMRAQKVDVVIADWNMPVMNGLELLKWMRNQERYANTPFMLLTAETSPDSVRIALKAGIDSYLVKPFTVHSFRSKFLGLMGEAPERPADNEQTGASLVLARRPAPPTAERRAMRPAGASGGSTLPPAQQQRSVIGLDEPLPDRLKKCTVLIVDDVANNIEVIAGALKGQYTIKIAISGQRALEIAQAFPIDIILLDIMMPVMDGFEVCRRLKADPNTADIPIIFLSARNRVEDVVAGLRIGAVDYISKPVDPTILKARLATHLMLATALGSVKRQNAHLSEHAQLREDVERMTQHDLKSPMAVALQASRALLDDLTLTAPQRAHAQLIEAATDNAIEMINRTLDLYKMESGSYTPVLEVFNLLDLLGKVVRQTEAAFTWKDVSMALPTRMHPSCLGESMLCYSLFSNLLKNAFEASPSGGTVTLELEQGHGNIEIAVSNQGEVPEPIRERFFDKYVTSNKAGGTGLGTYSAKLMAEIQGGKIRMETGDGRTKVTVTLLEA